ncbi:hypothetical protein HMPREF9554_00330 [Treponema phagedenis F0421]|nr:hypothetical protein HMPREF9554_00330 [Treponema phagedenis F0421]
MRRFFISSFIRAEGLISHSLKHHKKDIKPECNLLMRTTTLPKCAGC